MKEVKKERYKGKERDLVKETSIQKLEVKKWKVKTKISRRQW